jgi:decaprenyl-phosphate phosphoribosyltransferase
MILTFIRVFRPIRWYRNSFMILGILIAVRVVNIGISDILSHWMQIFLAFVSVCLIASGNYGINEVLDKEQDNFHPQKKHRALPSGTISPTPVILVSILLYVSGIGISLLKNNYMLTISLLLLLISGLLYNIPPVRLKDKPYLDFSFEALNNPIRLMVGWYSIAEPIHWVPATFILGYWFLGIFLMASKRFGELRFIHEAETAALYRKSLKYYTEELLLISMIAALVAFAYMFGALSMKYDINLFMVLPLIIIWTIWYFRLAYKENSIVKDPERIFEEKYFLIYTVFTFFVFFWLFNSSVSILNWLKN